MLPGSRRRPQRALRPVRGWLPLVPLWPIYLPVAAVRHDYLMGESAMERELVDRAEAIQEQILQLRDSL